jgi:hypothetical protein
VRALWRLVDNCLQTEDDCSGCQSRKRIENGQWHTVLEATHLKLERMLKNFIFECYHGSLLASVRSVAISCAYSFAVFDGTAFKHTQERAQVMQALVTQVHSDIHKAARPFVCSDQRVTKLACLHWQEHN